MTDLEKIFQKPRSNPTSRSKNYNPGRGLSKHRREKGLTLFQVGEMTGVAISTLSKIENNKVSPTYDVLVRLAEGLGVDFVDILDCDTVRFSPGIRTINRCAQGVKYTTSLGEYQALSTELAHKSLQPMIITVPFDSSAQPHQLSKHSGEEFIYVLDGEIDFFMEPYAPTRLGKGDSVHFDANMVHGLTAIGPREAVILSVCYADTNRIITQQSNRDGPT